MNNFFALSDYLFIARNYVFSAKDYVLSISPYFLGALAVAVALAGISLRWNKSPLYKAAALLTLGGMVWLVLAAVENTNNEIASLKETANHRIDLLTKETNERMARLIRETNNRIQYLLQTLRSQPKPVTFKNLQDMIPEGHPGHLILYGEVKPGVGIYLLLRSPSIPEPRYYLLRVGEKVQEEFKEEQHKADQKRTQLFIGGKLKSGRGDKRNGQPGRDGSPGYGTQRSEGGLGMFHQAPVTEDGPPKPN